MSEFTHVMWITWIKSVYLNYPGKTWSSTQNQTLSLMWGLSVKNGMFWSEIGYAFEDWGNKSKKISHYFTIRERKKTNLSELTQVFCGLLSKNFYAEIKCIGAKLTVVSLAAIVWSRHTMPYIPHLRERAHCMMRPKNGCKRDSAYCCSLNRKKVKIICLQ